jgi:hypothetical protein
MSELDYAYPMGCYVHYHPVIGGPHDGKIYQVIAQSDLGAAKGHRLVYWLEGKSGVCGGGGADQGRARGEKATAKVTAIHRHRRTHSPRAHHADRSAGDVVDGQAG